MHDPTPYLELLPAPRGLFDRLKERANDVRFWVASGPELRAVTWQAYAEATRAVACWLAARGITAEERAAIFAPNRVEWLCAAFGVQAAGGAMVPIYASSTAEQAGYVVEHSDAVWVFVDTPALLERVMEAWPLYSRVRAIILLDDSLDAVAAAEWARTRGCPAPALAELEAKLVRWSELQREGREWDAAHPGAFEDHLRAVELDQMGLMLYTSGTSGHPKGVPLSHRNVAVNGADWMRTFHPLVEERDVDLLWLPFSHVFGYGEAGIGNTLGWTSTLCTPAEVLSRLPEVQPTVFMSVPAYWEKLATMAAMDPGGDTCLALARMTGGRLRFCLSGGAGLKVEVKEFFQRCGLLIMEGYGLTECSPTLTLNRPHDFRFDTVGKPLDSVELKLAEDGEILARGPSVFRGYHKQPDATAEVFDSEGFFKTGDVGRWTDDGFLQIIDRKKDILVTAGGKNIPPANIERLFQDDPYIQVAVVYGEGKRYVTAGLWLDAAMVASEVGSADPDDARVRELIQRRVDLANERLAHHEAIRRFRIMTTPLTVEGGLLTPTLKVKRKKVWEVYGALFEELYS